MTPEFPTDRLARLRKWLSEVPDGPRAIAQRANLRAEIAAVEADIIAGARP